MTFPGGVHPPEYKEITEDKAIEAVPTPAQVSVLLSQHIGAICEPQVAKRDKVQAGQVIGKADAFVSATVHSPVDGTVKDIALQSHPVLGRVKAVIIDADPEQNSPRRPDPGRFTAKMDIGRFTPEQIRDAVGAAGLVGMGGAGFPTRVKLEPTPNAPKEVLVINGCECEPFITCDYRVMLEWTAQVLTGVRLAAKAAECPAIKIAIEDNKPQAVQAMRDAVAAVDDPAIEVVSVKTRYPQGGERQLINSVLGRQVPSGGIPPMIGVCVANVSTCAAIAEAVFFDTPLTHRVVTVTGSGIAKPGNYYVPVGMTVGDLVDHCGGLQEKVARVVMGGPMTGFAIADLSTPFTKSSGALTFLSRDMVSLAKVRNRQTPCIRCGRCLHVCPERLNPTKIAHAVKHDMLDVAKDYDMRACIECGCCSYVCPANIELTGYIKTGKVLEARAKRWMPQ